MSYNTDLQSNNEELQDILKQVNALPEAGSGGVTFDPSAYGLPLLALTGDTSAMSKDNAVTLNYVYGDRSGTCTVKWQGNSSLAYPKKNYTIKFDQEFEAVEGWGAQKKYCLKADFIDFSHTRNVVSAKLWGQIVRSRSGGTIDQIKALPNGGAVDGFPCVVTINGEFTGVYNFNIPKDGWMFGMGSGQQEAIICAENYVFDKAAVVDGTDLELEYVSDENNAAWVAESLNRLVTAVLNSDGTDIDTTIAQYLDIDSAIDYLIFTVMNYGTDNTGKNYILATYDGVKWFFSAYDMDGVWGLRWDGKTFFSADINHAISAGSLKGYARVHTLMKLLYTHKYSAIQKRYWELRSGPLSDGNVEKTFTDYASQIHRTLLEEDARLWPTIPSTETNDVSQIIGWFHTRRKGMDADVGQLEETGVTYYPDINGFIRLNGSISTSANYRRTDYLPLAGVKGIEYLSFVVKGSNMATWALFDQSKRWIASSQDENGTEYYNVNIAGNTVTYGLLRKTLMVEELLEQYPSASYIVLSTNNHADYEAKPDINNVNFGWSSEKQYITLRSVASGNGGVIEDTNATVNTPPVSWNDGAFSVKALGAKGDGSTDDTAVFQLALANYRTVYVPGGTYKLSGDLLIRDNCQLELAQDAVLNFTQTSGNCITMNRSAFLKGNHATVFVPYAFTGRVINVDTSVHTSTKDVPPWVHWDPQWKTARYLTDLNICKPDSYGIGQSTSGDSNGTAVYISADGSATSTFIWGLNFSGLRIAGAFEYGIRAQNFNNGWNHEMRLESFIDACKIGISLEDCNNAYISTSIQPRKAADGTTYAKHGIQLIRSQNTELSGTRIWDWNGVNTLWSYDKDNINQHFAMYGNCRGTILNDYVYYHIPTGFAGIRELIYTDTPSNFDSLIILQEPFTKWFKPIDNLPYFNNGKDGDQRLLLKSEQDALFQTKQVANFTNLLPYAIDDAGAIYNGVGYKAGIRINGADGLEYDASGYTSSGYIPCTAASMLCFSGMTWSDDGWNSFVLYNAQKERIHYSSILNILKGNNYFYSYSETENGFEVGILDRVEQLGAAYFRFTCLTNGVGSNPTVAVDEEISYSQEGFLQDGIYVSADYIHGANEKFVRSNQKVVEISANSTDEQYPTAKAVYDYIQQAIAAAMGQ